MEICTCTIYAYVTLHDCVFKIHPIDTVMITLTFHIWTVVISCQYDKIGYSLNYSMTHP